MLTFDGMRSRLYLVITGCLVCHLLLGSRPVTSQALTPDQKGCHVVLTAPPKATEPQSGGSDQVKRKPKIVISPDEPVEISARQCENAGKVYNLRGDVEIKVADYIFHGES